MRIHKTVKKVKKQKKLYLKVLKAKIGLRHLIFETLNRTEQFIKNAIVFLKCTHLLGCVFHVSHRSW
jgi:hypothetical protein